MSASSGRILTALSPVSSEFIRVSTPRPNGEIAPIPVMTTRFNGMP